MLFNSVHFYIFAPIVIVVFFLLNERWQRYWLFVASLYFYAVFEFAFILLLLYSIVITYIAIRRIVVNTVEWKRQGWLAVAVFGNLLLLLVFKYLHLIYDVINFFLGAGVCEPSRFQGPLFLLPMGISFFGLQAISAAVDVYRGNAKPPVSLLRFGLFLSFFPQLVAGPILRTKDLLDQFDFGKQFTADNFRIGIGKLSVGFFKKTIIADALSPIVDEVFANPAGYNSVSLWISVFVFSFQIYCDFSGYSDIAIGIARILGYKFPENFDRPFFSTTVGEFWRRWHISFSSWLRDYVYIPLGGSRVSVSRAYINLFATMVISGLWHGADWNFLVWGAIHGGFVALERLVLSVPSIRSRYQKLPPIIGMFYVYWVFSVAFFYFRCKPVEIPGIDGLAAPIQVAWFMTVRSFSFVSGSQILVPWNAIALVVLLLGLEWLQESKGRLPKIDSFIESVIGRPTFVYAASISVLLVCLYIYSVTFSQPFVYFQF
ncbi:MAG: MBOAT family protein [Leptonema sp. (in: Bacteria)]|nr:MBOAT family protein [Leptonema sp. (in: bacteria)]